MDGLKQRVVGALVIVSLAVIFLPMIFDEPHQPSKTQLIPIPVQPELPVITLNSPQKPSFKIIEPSDDNAQNKEAPTSEAVKNEKSDAVDTKVVDAKKPVESTSTTTTVSKSATPIQKASATEVPKTSAPAAKMTKPTTAKSNNSIFKEKALSNVWMVQLGTFGNHKNAYQLRDSLREAGFDSHTTKVDKDGKKLVRVFSGPYADKAYANKIKKQLDKKFKLKTLVVHFK